MANIATIITAVILALSAFYAFKNKEAVTSLNTEIAALQGQKESTTEKLKTTQNLVTAAKVEIEETQAEVEQLQTDLAAEKANVQDLDSSIVSKKDEREANAQRITEVRGDIDRFGNLDQILSDVDDNQARIAELQDAIISQESRIAILTKAIESKKAVAEKLTQRRESVTSLKSSPSLSTSIRTAMNKYGFVIINGGDNIGIAANSQLEVLRGGEVVAKLRVTSVESASSAASIIPSEDGETVALRSGDRIVASAS